MPVLEVLGIEKGEAASSGGPDIGPLQEKGACEYFRLRQGRVRTILITIIRQTTPWDKIDPERLKQNVAAWAVVTYLAAEIEE